MTEEDMELTIHERAAIDEYILRKLGLYQSQIHLFLSRGFLSRPEVQEYIEKRTDELLQMHRKEQSNGRR